MSIIKITDSKKVNTTRLSPHFSAKEFACNHCGQVVIDKNLVDQLEQFRSLVGNQPILITSPYRCPYWNKHEGGSATSLHMAGRAVDFEMYDRHNAIQMFNSAVKVFNRVGLYQSGKFPNQAYMHVDNAAKGTYWLSWNEIKGYNSNGKPIVKRTYIYFKNLNNMMAAMKQDKNRDWFNMVI
ncbi:MAG TPA: D-Ala-D-Ala carboxypeptidase family metallohydrolase [Bacilli bacterium]|nr:D-Ala-D-Ala carboxypeptidase family metallohydrolase [Bacilli bacterium]